MPEDRFDKSEDHLPGLNTPLAWAKVLAVLLATVLINLVVAFASWGWGIVITLPFSIFLAFLLLRDMIPRHRLPRGRQPQAGRPA